MGGAANRRIACLGHALLDTLGVPVLRLVVPAFVEAAVGESSCGKRRGVHEAEEEGERGEGEIHYTCTRTHTHRHTCTHALKHTSTCMSPHMHAHMHARKHTHSSLALTFTHTCTRMASHTRMCAYIRRTRTASCGKREEWRIETVE